MNYTSRWGHLGGMMIAFFAVVAGGISSYAQSEPPAKGVVYVCLFMHNEDNLFRDLTSDASRTRYIANRAALVDFGRMLHRNNVKYNWEPEWLFLEAALRWDTPEVMSTTNGKNIVRYLKEDLQISVDPHSHENHGYNYADVAKLIDSLGVTPTNVIGGHVWDPYSTGFQEWDRFRLPLQGSKYPWYTWKGEILIGSGTPNHTNDPEPSGIWRPRDRYHYFEDDPGANVYAVGQYTGDMDGVRALVELYRSGAVSPDSILTVTISARQGDLPMATVAFEDSVIAPLLEMQSRGEIRIVTFPELIEIFETQYGGEGHIYNAPTAGVAESDERDNASTITVAPNPVVGSAMVRFSLPVREEISVKLYTSLGDVVATIAEGEYSAGEHAIALDAVGGTGIYYVRLQTSTATQTRVVQVVSP